MFDGMDAVSVERVRVWEVGPGQRACVVRLVSGEARDVTEYRRLVQRDARIWHLTIEVRVAPSGAGEIGTTV